MADQARPGDRGRPGSRPLPDPPRGATPATLIAGRYRVREPLGKGGMASVWSVDDEQSGKRLALKRLSNGADPRYVALFEREYHTLATLNHPCIVQAHEYASDAAGPFYTMELLDGSDVSKRVPLPYVEVCRILRDVASGLALLHARRLIHRDLSAHNVWLMPDGRVKLIDFGTMVTFGKAAYLAGTAPYIAPESLHGRDLDQRTDLYGLGALGYYLLSGRHAFPAHTLVELSSVWNERPRPVSKRVAELGRSDLPEVPPALDTLIDSLLGPDPLARPTTAADVIDRLTVIASLEPDQQGRVVESYLTSPAFVGREPERAALRGAFAQAVAGKGGCVVVESTAGLGRSRLLSEFALEARLSGAAVLQTEPRTDGATHDIAQQCALELLAALPEAALQAAAPYASTLGHLSPELRKRLRVEKLAAMPPAHGEARMRLQVALRDWFLDVARRHPIVIVADDFEAFDEGSTAWLVALGRAAEAHKLLVVASLCGDRAPFGLAIAAFRQGARRLSLGPFSQDETGRLLRSVFGDVQHLARLVDLVHQRAEGSPGHTMDLADHLVREGIVTLAAGAWVLPQTIAADALPANRADADVARLGRLPGPARELGQSLSVREGPIPLDLCARLAEMEGPVLFGGLEALVREGVLVGSEDGYRFSRDALRSMLLAELPEEKKRRAHRRLGHFLLASKDVSELERLKGGVHLLRGGDEEMGSRTVTAAGKHYGLVDLADLGPAVPSLEAALEHFRAARRPLHELVALLAPLALAGYYADHHLATRYGEEAVRALETVVGLRTARRLRPFLGRKLSLFVALGAAAAVFAAKARGGRGPSHREAIMMLFNCVAALTGVCTICIDPRGGAKYAAVLEPMTALGKNHVATFMYHFCLNLVGTIRDRVGQARANWMRMTERLDRPNAVRDLPANVHALYLGGALYARGVAECWRDDSQALECAERLDGLRLKLYDMSADQVRMMYYANRGDREAFERYRRQVEVHAIQRGTAWQVEMWTYSGLITVYMRTGDVAGLKDCVEQLKRLSTEFPSLHFGYMRALGAYLVTRGTPSAALDVIGEGEQPLELVGWTRGEGLRARAYNALGQHAVAKETCERALAAVKPEDLEFPALNLGIQIEHARAEAGLGNLAEAEKMLRALLEAHSAGQNLLTMGALHEALAETAALRGSESDFATHLAEVGKWFRSTRDPALVARYERLARVGAALSTQVPDPTGLRRSSSRPPRLMTVVHRLRHGGDYTPAGSAEWALKQVTELTGATRAFLFVPEHGSYTCAARVGVPEVGSELTHLVCERLVASDPEENVKTTTSDSLGDPSRLEIGDQSYRLLVVRASAGDRDEIMGAFVLPSEVTVPFPVIQAIADRLAASESVSV